MPPSALELRSGPNGQYWVAEFEVVMNLGTSELVCHVEWEENVSRSALYADLADGPPVDRAKQNGMVLLTMSNRSDGSFFSRSRAASVWEDI